MRAQSLLSRCTRPVIEALERRVLLHGIGPDGKPINDGDGNETGAVIATEFGDGTTNYSFASAAGQTAGAAVAGSPWTTGNKTVLFIRATYADQPTNDPESASAAQSEMDTVNQFILDNSFNQASLTTTVTDLIVLPHTLSYYLSQPQGDFVLRDDALAAAKAANPAWDYTLFNFDAVRFNGGPGSYSGQAYVGDRGVWLKTSSPGVAEHEFGHNFGNWHANSWTLSNPQTIIGPGTNTEYGDPFDVMGPAGGGAQHYNIYYKWALNWVPDANVIHAASSGTYKLFANDLGGTVDANATYGIDIKKDDRDYWLDFRQNSGWSGNPWVMNGVGVRWSPFSGVNGNSNGGSELLDTTPNSPSGLSDAYLVVGRTFDDNVSGIHVTPIAKHAAANGDPPYMDVVVNIGSFAGDHAPTGTVNASALSVAPGAAVNFSANASDVDGDALAYYWDFGDKTFGGNTPTASHSWSTAGQYRVRLTVSDMKGRSFSKSVIITVGSPASTSTITGRVVDANGNPVADAFVTNNLPTFDGFYRTAYTDSDGTYTLAGVGQSAYTITASKAGWTIAAADFNGSAVVGGSAQAVTNVDFRATPVLYKISGKVTLDGATPVAGAVVSDGAGQNEPTDSAGNYTLWEPLGTYSMTVAKAGLSFVGAASVETNFGDATRNFSAVGAYVSGQVTGLPSGTTVTLSDGLNTTAVKTATQGQGGTSGTVYTLGPLPLGSWYITASAAGFTLSPAGGWANPLTVSGATSGADFVVTGLSSYILRGRLTDRGQALAGATVTLIGGAGGPVTVTTDSYGDYAFTGLGNATYTVTPSKAGTSFTQSSAQVTINGADGPATNFVTTTVNQPPTVATAGAVMGGAKVAGVSANLSVLGADADDGEGLLKYEWNVVSAPIQGAVTFDKNAANSAKNVLATFNRAGTYVLRATITDPMGASVTSDVTVNVVPTPTFAAIAPDAPTIQPGAAQQFTAGVYDQFGAALETQPTFTWSAGGVGGSIDSQGLYTAPGTLGEYVINVSGGGLGASVTGQVTNQAPTIVSGPTATPSTVTGKTAALSVLGDDDGGEANLTYTWSVAGTPPAPVSFNVNGTNTAKNATATFSKAGDYLIKITITDAGGLSVNTSFFVTVTQTLTSIAVTPGAASAPLGGTQQFSGVAVDQFGNAMGAPVTISWGVSGTGNAIDSNGLLTAGNAAGTFIVTASGGGVSGTAQVSVGQASVVARQLFHNHSAWDGNDAGANALDDGAIDSSKSALLPGQTASGVNFTGDYFGINGVMIDVANLPVTGLLSAGDFAFKFGSGGDPGTWADAPAPVTILVRRGAGASGSDRVELVWADGAVKNGWLQVTLKPDANSGLTSADVFYFGNLQGDVNGNGVVTGGDVSVVKAAVGGAVTASTASDLNHNGVVSGGDVSLAKLCVGGSLTMLSAPAGAALAAAVGDETNDGVEGSAGATQPSTEVNPVNSPPSVVVMAATPTASSSDTVAVRHAAHLRHLQHVSHVQHMARRKQH